MDDQLIFRADLNRFVSGLFGYEKLFFVEHFIEGYSADEISIRYGISKSTVKRRIRRLRTHKIERFLAEAA